MSNGEFPNRVSSYLDHLPAIFQPEADAQGVNFIARFLLAFEQLLSGLGDPEDPGLEEIIGGILPSESGETGLGGIHRYFDPGPNQPVAHRAPDEFLEWLAGWVALRLREDWKPDSKRQIIREIAYAYRRRGTREGLEWALKTFTQANLKWDLELTPTVNELNTPFQIGVHSEIEKDTWIEGGPPNYFEVSAPVKTGDPEKIAPYYEVLTAIIDEEKPAYTYYKLDLDTPGLVIGISSNVGINTLLGTSMPRKEDENKKEKTS